MIMQGNYWLQTASVCRVVMLRNSCDSCRAETGN